MAYITNLAHVKTFDGVVYDMKARVHIPSTLFRPRHPTSVRSRGLSLPWQMSILS